MLRLLGQPEALASVKPPQRKARADVRDVSDSKELVLGDIALAVLVDAPDSLAVRANGDKEPAWTCQLLDERLGVGRSGSTDVDGIEAARGKLVWRCALSAVASDDLYRDKSRDTAQ